MSARRVSPLVLAGLSVLLFGVSVLVSMAVGSRDTAFTEILRALPAAARGVIDPGFLTSIPFDDTVLLLTGQRIPRTVLAVMSGMALGVAGTLMQGLTRNPLADPGILGVNAGAAAAVAVGMATGLVPGASDFVWPALIGAVAVTALLFLLSSLGPTAANPLVFVLAGMAMTALLMAVVNALMLKDAQVLDALRVWAAGSVANRDLGVARTVAPLVVAGLVAALSLGGALNLLSLGEDVAHTLGLPVTRYRVIGMLSIAVLGAVAVACAGPVSFIGLAAPHMIRGLTGPDYRAILPISVVVGGLLALWADILGRLLARPAELPMGIVLALLGVPLFIWLVRRGRVGGSL